MNPDVLSQKLFRWKDWRSRQKLARRLALVRPPLEMATEVCYCQAAMAEGRLLRGRGTRGVSAATEDLAWQFQPPEQGDRVAMLRLVVVRRGLERIMVDERVVSITSPRSMWEGKKR